MKDHLDELKDPIVENFIEHTKEIEKKEDQNDLSF
jgi:hypothetical protein